jgi:hypothetical protein
MGVQPLSQYVMNEQSHMIDNDMGTFEGSDSHTESELDDDEAETQGLINSVQFNMSSYRDYLIWSMKNKVQVEKVKTGFVDK